MENLPTKEIGVSAICGFCSGYALKQVGRLLAIGIGLTFVGFQVAKQKGWIDGGPNWQQVNQTLTSHADLNGDGKVDVQDVKIGLAQVQDYLGVGLPSVGGFAGGFAAGLYFG